MSQSSIDTTVLFRAMSGHKQHFAHPAPVYGWSTLCGATKAGKVDLDDEDMDNVCKTCIKIVRSRSRGSG